MLVFNPDLLSLKESLRLIEGLNELKLPLRLLLLNKTAADNQETAAQVEKKLKSVTSADIKRVTFPARISKKQRLFTVHHIREDLTPYFR